MVDVEAEGGWYSAKVVTVELDQLLLDIFALPKPEVEEAPLLSDDGGLTNRFRSLLESWFRRHSEGGVSDGGRLTDGALANLLSVAMGRHVMRSDDHVLHCIELSEHREEESPGAGVITLSGFEAINLSLVCSLCPSFVRPTVRLSAHPSVRPSVRPSGWPG